MVFEAVELRDNLHVFHTSLLFVNNIDPFNSLLHVEMLDLLDELAALDLNKGKEVFHIELQEIAHG